MQIAVIGINHKQGSLSLRESLTLAFHTLFSKEKSQQKDHFFVLLSTCNRTEIYFSSTHLSETHTYILCALKPFLPLFVPDFDQKLYSFFGKDCFEHLLKVTSGLDSAFPGETEIQRQVKEAYLTTSEFVALPADLHFLFQKSLQSAKYIRTTFSLEQKSTSLEKTLWNVGLSFFKDKKPSILFIGASLIHQKIAHFFHQKKMPFTITTRNFVKGQKFAEKFEGTCLPFEEKKKWFEFDWIMVATKAPSFLLKEEDELFLWKKQKLLIDLSLPRNIDPSLKKLEGISLYDIDDIHSLEKLSQEVFHSLFQEASFLVTKEALKHYTFFQIKNQLFQDTLEKEWCL